MPTNIPNVAAWTTNIPGPVAGDLLSAADDYATAQGLTDRTNYLKSLAPSANAATLIAVSTISGFVPSLTGWHPATSAPSLLGAWSQASVSAAHALAFDLDVPSGVTLTELAVTLDGGAGSSHSALPGTMPAVALSEIDPLVGLATIVATQIDPSPDVATYESTHVVTLTVSQVVDPTKRYALVVTGETGANSLTNVLITRGARVSWTGV